MYKFILFTLLLVVISGYSQKVNIAVLEPVEIDRVANTKKIAVTRFKNDNVGLSSKIEAILANIKINNKNFFTR